MATTHKAVALISGGLDSMLAAKLILDQGVHVEGLNFFTGFCVQGHTHAIRSKDRARPKRNNALWVAEKLGIKLHIVEVVDEYKAVVTNPRHGYGAHLNPCLDCKTFMVGKARVWMDENGFDFIITGEVLGQRPKSQLKSKLPVVARESGACDRLLRPLSAKMLDPTLPEREGWVDRSKLGDITGRGRKRQIAIARVFGWTDYAQPAGGCCFLTDASYARKLSDLWTARGNRTYDFDDIMLLKVGRHLRLRANFKLIIARDEGENNFLRGYRDRFTHIVCDSHHGPLALVDGQPGPDDLNLAARVIARFGKGRDAGGVRMRVNEHGGIQTLIDVVPLPAEQILHEWYL